MRTLQHNLFQVLFSKNSMSHSMCSCSFCSSVIFCNKERKKEKWHSSHVHWSRWERFKKNLACLMCMHVCHSLYTVLFWKKKHAQRWRFTRTLKQLPKVLKTLQPLLHADPQNLDITVVAIVRWSRYTNSYLLFFLFNLLPSSQIDMDKWKKEITTHGFVLVLKDR